MLEGNKEYTVQLKVEHPDMENHEVRVEIMPEPVELSEGGNFKPRPVSYAKNIKSLLTKHLNSQYSISGESAFR